MDRKQGYFEKFRNRASSYLDDRLKMNQLLEKAHVKMDKGKEHLSEAWDTIQIFYRMLKAYVKGDYRDIPKDKVLMIIAAFIYLVSPIDAIMDFLPGGLIDDAAIFLWLFASLREEIKQFRLWEESQGQQQ